MGERDDLLQVHIETLYVLDDPGDMLTSNEPYPPARRQAPAFHLGWTSSRYQCCFRNDVPDSVRRQVCDLVARQWPFQDPKGPPDESRYARVLADYSTGRSGSGPAFIVPEGALPSGDATRVTVANAHILDPGFTDCIEEVGHTQPFFAVTVEGRAVSICQTVRRSPHGLEAGVDTLDGHRRRGYARRAVAAWCEAARDEGLTGFYSTTWSNEASCGLAISLRLHQFAVEISVF